MKTNKLIPKLRFKEFSGEWDIEPMGNLSEEITEKTKGRKYKLMSITSGIGLVSQIEKFGREIAGNSYNNYFVINKGDFAYNKSSTKLYPEGEIALLENEEQAAVPNSIFTCFRFKNTIYPLFAKFLFVNNLHGGWLKKTIAVGARANGALQVNNKDLFSIPFPFPSLFEQQKIAAFLTSLDDLIAAEQQKLSALKTHKKGLMQQLFPAAGEKVPRLRFEGFEGEWEEKKLGEVGDVTTGNKDTQDKVNGGMYPFFVRSQTVERINTFSYDGEAILTSGDGVGVGKNFHYIVGKFDFHQRVYSIYNFKEGINGKFVYLYFSEHFNKRVMAMSAKNSVDSVRMAMITEMPMLIPTIPEQTKIASFLTSLDDLIAAQGEKVEVLKRQKKGLMQQLFPSIKE